MKRYIQLTSAFGILVLATVTQALSQGGVLDSTRGLDQVTDVRFSTSGTALRLVVETRDRPAEASVFYYTGPERLFIEFNDALPGTKLAAPPKTPMVSGWSLKQTAMNRSQLVLTLNHRPSTSELSISRLESPHRLVVEVPLETGVDEALQLTEGVKWIRKDQLLDGRWVRLNRLVFDPKDPKVEVKLGLANESTNARETVSSMIARHGSLAGINGGYYAGSGGVLGLVYRDGKLVAPHVSRRPPRSGFGLTSDGRALFGRLAGRNGAIVDLEGGDWSDAVVALGGGPRLMQNGATRITAKEEELGPGGNDITRVAARTLVAQQQNGELVFATVSGFRDNHSQGAKFEPVVAWLKGLGIKDAVNFDGGASVDMVIGKHIVSDGPGNATNEKAVATALLINDPRPRLYPSQATWKIEKKVLQGDGVDSGSVEVSVSRPDGSPVPDGTEVRFFAHNLVVEPALVKTTNGVAKTRVRAVQRRGPARLTMQSGPVWERQEFELRGGSVARIWATPTSTNKLESQEQAGWQRTQYKVQLVDEWGTSVAGARFRVAVAGAEPQEFATDTVGMGSFLVDTPPGGAFSVVLSSGSAPALTLQTPRARYAAAGGEGMISYSVVLDGYGRVFRAQGAALGDLPALLLGFCRRRGAARHSGAGDRAGRGLHPDRRRWGTLSSTLGAPACRRGGGVGGTAGHSRVGLAELVERLVRRGSGTDRASLCDRSPRT